MIAKDTSTQTNTDANQKTDIASNDSSKQNAQDQGAKMTYAIT